MRTIILKKIDARNNSLAFEKLPIPIIKANEVLVKVHAISVNPVDVKTAEGKGVYSMIKDQHPIILGWDISGVVVDTGEEVIKFKKDDEVFGMVNFPGLGKAYAEYIAIPQRQLALKPKNINHEEAAASTLAALSAWQFLVNKAGIKSGDRVLILGASGGVGHFAIQIAKHFDAYVIGTSSAKNKDFVLSLGADEHIDYQNQDFESVVSNIDIVLDTIGRDYIERSFAVIKKGGCLITTPSPLNDEQKAKAKAQEINAHFFLVKSNGEDMAEIAHLLEKDIIETHISQTYPFEQMQEAHLQIASGRTVGKVVVTV